MTGQKASSTAVHSPAHTAGSLTPYEATLSTIAEYFVDLDGHAYVVVRGQPCRSNLGNSLMNYALSAR